jgi:starvation-inducible DNA-binding protein
MENVAYIGLETEKMEGLTEKLNELLANYQIFYMNVRGFHWNIKGGRFFELHAKFEEVYTDALKKVDEIAERIKTLGYTPMHTFSEYSEISEIREKRNISDGIRCVEYILEGFKTIINIEREILEMSRDANDEGTNTLMGDYIREQEKLIWMFNSYLGE